MTQHHSALAHHFDTMEQQKEASSLGMWAFLVTEVMLFGGLFMAYIVYRWAYPTAFAEASHHLNWPLATVNTVVLLISSLTVALGVAAAEEGKRKQLLGLLIATIVLGAVFLGIKFTEYGEKFSHCADPAGHECLVPGKNFHFPSEETGAATTLSVAEGTTHSTTQERGHQIFYLLYFTATGIHAIHMIVGITVMSVITFMAWKGRFDTEYYNPVEISGLYWHLIDIVWVFLFPLFYLIVDHHGK